MWGMKLGSVVLVGVLIACSGGDDDDATKDTKGKQDTEVAADPSAGCEKSAVKSGEEKVTLRTRAEDRWYYRHVPPAHDGRTPVPVVVDIHGYSEGADVHKQMSMLGPFGDTKGFVTLTPQGTGPVPLWRTDVASPDVAFVGAMLDDVEETLCVDQARVYVTGLSNGAMMTSTLACTLDDRIAAAAPVAGVSAIGDCEPDRAVPVVAFHGTADPFLDYEGGFGPAVANLPSPDGKGNLGDVDSSEEEQASIDTSASVPDVMAAWAERNGCTAGGEPAETEVAADVTELVYDCPTGRDVELYRIEDGGHTWPGSELLKGVDMVGKTTFSIDADEVMWDFFEQHPLR